MKKNIAAELVEKLLSYATKKLEWQSDDIIYARNSLLDMLKIDEPASPCDFEGDFQTEIVDKLLDYAKQSGLIEEDYEKILFETKLFSAVTPLPSVINKRFEEIAKKKGIEAATTWMFELSKANNYVRMVDINKNLKWEHNGSRGGLTITINLSKPEKDPKQIAAALAQKKAQYPACLLCADNVGFAGSANHPARQTLRVIPLKLNNEPWGLQYSPYQYYDKHIIALSCEHRPMKVDENCLARLADFVGQFPHFFMGSNAALPIVGGSILTHDHYQGGSKVLPMFKAPVRKTYDVKNLKGVKVSTVDWYNSVVRVECKNQKKTVEAASYILNKWKVYSDESVGIISATDAQHNAITPIARMENGKYVIDLILRNNRTDSEHPFGIFHPTEDLHNIKKEGIGIIEVMGIFILPGRLKNELSAIEQYLKGKKFDEKEIVGTELEKHINMIQELISQNPKKLTAEKATQCVVDYINNACERILECTAVFKNDQKGQAAFEKFMLSL